MENKIGIVCNAVTDLYKKTVKVHECIDATKTSETPNETRNLGLYCNWLTYLHYSTCKMHECIDAYKE